jgi:antirestriction protein ArdC
MTIQDILCHLNGARRHPKTPIGLIMPEVEALSRASGANPPLGGDKAFYALALDYI